MNPAHPELPRRPRRSSARRARTLIAAAGTALLAVTCIAAAAAARDNSPRADQPAKLSADTTSALTDNWYAVRAVLQRARLQRARPRAR